MRPIQRPPVNGEVIREARLDKGMTQEEVQDECKRLGRRVHNISRMENGDTKWPSPRVFPVLARVLGLEIRDLFAPCRQCGHPWSAACASHAERNGLDAAKEKAA
jgi:transcriptional regulator with XRE-family HTH domain